MVTIHILYSYHIFDCPHVALIASFDLKRILAALRRKKAITFCRTFRIKIPNRSSSVKGSCSKLLLPF